MIFGDISVVGEHNKPKSARLIILEDDGKSGKELEEEVIAILAELESYPITAVELTRVGKVIDATIIK